MTDIVTREIAFPSEPGVAIAGYAAMPAAAEGRPAVLVLSEIWGVNANMRSVCDRLARAGVIAYAIDLFRGEKPPAYADPIEHVMAYFGRFDDLRGIRDCRAAIGFMEAGGLGARPGSIFPWGFCMGGRFAHYLAAVDGRIAGAINFYGRVDFARDPSLKPFTPLDLAGLIAAPYLGMFGERDKLIPHAGVEALREALAARGHPHRIEICRGADHAFFNDERPSFHPPTATRAWDEVLRFVTTGRLA